MENEYTPSKDLDNLKINEEEIPVNSQEDIIIKKTNIK
jgi:hypothetical protein